MKRFLTLLFIIIASINLAGCGDNNQTIKPIVSTKEIKEEYITKKIESTGRILAEYEVDIVARIDGYLQKKYFNEGAIVKKGDLLYQIEPYTYAAKVNEASANLRNAQASLVDSSKNLKRAAVLVKEDFISKTDYDNHLATRDRDRASVDSARAALTQAKINYGYTKIYSPISGKIGRIYITEGNFVTPSSGPLALVVSVDPIFLDFTLKSKQYLILKKASQEENLKDISVEIKLADDTVYESKGKISFVDNVIDESSGSVIVRAIFDNKKHLLVPGDYVSVTVTMGKPKQVILVPQEAVIQTETTKYLYVVDEDKIAHTREIAAEEDYNGNWIVTSGLNIGEKIALTGLQYLQDGQEVILQEELKKQGQQNLKKTSFFKRIARKMKSAIKKVLRLS